MNIYEAMKNALLKAISQVDLEVVSVRSDEREKKDKEGDGIEVEKFIKIGVEVPRGNGELSRKRFYVKIVDGALNVTQSDVDENVYMVKFTNLSISYVDSGRQEVYFKADGYEMEVA